jgi:metal-responsive CopG/Arc/MetJ family transcriptional regulator
MYIPERLVREIDRQSRKAGMSRSRFISNGLEALFRRQARLRLSLAFDAVFSDESTRKEQEAEADLFDSLPLDEDRW